MMLWGEEVIAFPTLTLVSAGDRWPPLREFCSDQHLFRTLHN